MHGSIRYIAMIPVLEDHAKAWLASAGLPVPLGERTAMAETAAAITERLGGESVVKALIPTGRRGKAGAVIRARTPQQAANAAGRLLGSTVSGYLVSSVYVEQLVAIASEFYLAFTFDQDGPCVVLSRHGGVDIEAGAAARDATLTTEAIAATRGLPPWEAIDLWHRAGVRGPVLRELGMLTSRLYDCFRRHDAELLEINPLAIDLGGHAVLVGAMLALDQDAKGRHPDWDSIVEANADFASRTSREARVAAIDAAVPGGECRYVELGGDIGLLVGGGGAGLYQHDRMLAYGGRPANHSVTPPTGSDNRKLKAVIEAIIDNPHARALLVGFNFAQMARADIRVRTLLEVVDEKEIDTAQFPIVIRLFGAGEEEARARVAGRKGIHYLPREASLDDAIRLIVSLAADATATRAP